MGHVYRRRQAAVKGLILAQCAPCECRDLGINLRNPLTNMHAKRQHVQILKFGAQSDNARVGLRHSGSALVTATVCDVCMRGTQVLGKQRAMICAELAARPHILRSAVPCELERSTLGIDVYVNRVG